MTFVAQSDPRVLLKTTDEARQFECKTYTGFTRPFFFFFVPHQCTSFSPDILLRFSIVLKEFCVRKVNSLIFDILFEIIGETETVYII